MRRLLALATLVFALPAGAVTTFSGGGAYVFNGTTNTGVLVSGNSVLDIVAPASLTEPGTTCDPSDAGALCVGTPASPGYVNVRGGLVESAVLANGYMGIADGTVDSINVPSGQYNASVHVFGGEVGSVQSDSGSSLELRVFDGLVGSLMGAESVEILGGEVGAISGGFTPHSWVTVSAGTVGFVDRRGGTVAIVGGSVGSVSVTGDPSAYIDIHGGEIAGLVRGEDAALVSIDGGTFSGTDLVLQARVFSSVTLSGGVFEPGADFFVGYTGTLSVSGSNLRLVDTGSVGSGIDGPMHSSRLTGVLLDGNPIDVDVLTVYTSSVALNGALTCSNGLDDDGDGLVDFDDPGCLEWFDISEHRQPTEYPPLPLPCDDGVDNDGDGLKDYLAAGGGDPGCNSPTSNRENPQCQDGLNNDFNPGIDFDGGASLDLDHDGRVDAQFNLAIPLVGAPDPQCTAGWMNRESSSGCGLGFELVFFAPVLARLARRRS